ncbi:hypothetical protein BUE93_21540 [Chromobacterium amazonense]|uniref:Uncharacterized protein n=1 Tax=Chromobacterium amazonense TaxID=1382803 RepID=A0A2S9WYT1_9NEIS|nr:hypothetical protein BUE93_21540 [Chromobacterium amazonense]
MIAGRRTPHLQRPASALQQDVRAIRPHTAIPLHPGIATSHDLAGLQRLMRTADQRNNTEAIIQGARASVAIGCFEANNLPFGSFLHHNRQRRYIGIRCASILNKRRSHHLDSLGHLVQYALCRGQPSRQPDIALLHHQRVQELSRDDGWRLARCGISIRKKTRLSRV